LSHSKPDEPIDDSRMVEIYADDVHRLLQKVAGQGRADVFASSGGAVIVLELAKRHSEQLGTVIAHEPPSPELLPNTDEVRARMEDVCDTCAKDGLYPAMQKFMTLVGIQSGQPPQEGVPSPEQKEAIALMQGNMEFFFVRYIRN